MVLNYPVDSNFCTNCGASIEDTPKTNFNYPKISYELKNFLKDIFSSPVQCCKEYTEILSEKFSYIYFSIILLISSITLTFLLKIVIKSVFSSILSTLNDFSALYQGYYSSSDLMVNTYYMNTIINSIFPSFNIYFFPHKIKPLKYNNSFILYLKSF